jgi:neutral trehalase
MSIIADELGYSEDKIAYDKKAENLITRINHLLWDEATGFYYDRDERTGERIPVKAVSGFTPLWLGIASPEQAKRLVYEHLLDPGEFWTKYPVASYAKSEPDYCPYSDGLYANWRGPNWIPTTYMIFHGLMKYGYFDIAKFLAYQTFDMVLHKNRNTREFYNAETGEGYNLDSFCGWSVLAYYMPLEFELLYDPTDVQNRCIFPLEELLSVDPPLYPKTSAQVAV